MNISANDGRPRRRVSIRSKVLPVATKRNGEVLGVYVSRDSKDQVIARAVLNEVPASIPISKTMEGVFCDNEFVSSLPG